MAKRENKTDVSHLGSSEKTVLIHLLQEQNNLLHEKYQRLEIRFKALEDKLAKNSSNSSKPPSSDSHKPSKNKDKKPKKTTSSRTKSGKKPGGQPGHPGHHLKMSDAPDEFITLPVTECAHCKHDLSRVKGELESRQVYDIPEPKMWVTEYQAAHKYCRCCGYTTSACFPEDVSHKAQYGPRAKSLMVYLNEYQFIPFERVGDYFKAVYQQGVSAGTVVNAVKQLSVRIEDVELSIKTLLITSSLNHCDETSVNINGKKQWLHTVGNEQLTHYGLHQKRGRDAMNAIGILPEFKGTLVHDHWKSYFYYDCVHGLCNGHHIRELRFINEQHGIKWAKKVSNLLLKINAHKDSLLAQGRYFSKRQLKAYSAEYDEILGDKATREQARRGTKDSRNLLRRLRDYKASALLFMNDKSVPFTNNLSERDIRMMKVKQKISGCFRSSLLAEHFCRVRSVISTAKKNNKVIFNVLQDAFSGTLTINDLLSDTT